MYRANDAVADNLCLRHACQGRAVKGEPLGRNSDAYSVYARSALESWPRPTRCEETVMGSGCDAPSVLIHLFRAICSFGLDRSKTPFGGYLIPRVTRVVIEGGGANRIP